MARFTNSPLTPNLRGKLGGLSLSTSSSGSTIKVGGSPRKYNSLQANQARNTMDYLQVQWKNLTNAQRENWTTYSNFRPVEQINNPGRFINGQQYFIKYNTAYFYQFGTIVSSPVFAVDTPFTDTLEIDRGLIELNVQSTINIDETNDFCIFKISGQMSPARSKPPGGVKQILLTFGNTQQCVITGTYMQLFGLTPQAGDTLFVEYTFFKTQFIQWSNTTRVKVEVQ